MIKNRPSDNVLIPKRSNTLLVGLWRVTHLSRVGSNLFVMLLFVPIFFLLAGTYGLTTLRMDNGEKYELPKQIIQSQRSHALVDYKKYCDETGFQSLGKSKLYDIIDSIKAAEQRIVAGLDEFVVEGIEAWRSLSSNGKELGPLVVKSNLLLLLDIVETMSIPQADRKRLIKQIDMAEQYKKHQAHWSLFG